jgi:hypothetical protein
MSLPFVSIVCGTALTNVTNPSPGVFLNNHLAHDTYTTFSGTLFTGGASAAGGAVVPGGTTTGGPLTTTLMTPFSLQYRAGGQGAANAPRNWNGPYIKEVLTDPWGHNYILYTHAMNRSRLGPAGLQIYAWLLSAGANGRIETLPTGTSVQGDDIGVVVSIFNIPEDNFRIPQR